MKWRLVACLMLAACMVLPLATAVSADNTTRVTGTVPPSLECSDVRATDIGYHGATVRWQTAVAANSTVYYDTVSRADIDDYRFTEEDLDLVEEHSVRLTGLSSSRIYYYRVRAQVPDTGFACVSDEHTFRTRTPTGPSPRPPPPTPPTPEPPTPAFELKFVVEGVETIHPLSEEGEVLERIERTSPDGKVTIIVPEGTLALDKDGNPLTRLDMDTDPDPCAPPEGAHIIGLAYRLTPTGASFDPQLTITWQYDPADIPQGMAEEDLVIACCDRGTGQWTKLPSSVNPQNKTVTAQASHFTSFAVVSTPPARYDLVIASTAGGSVTTPGEETFTYDARTVVELAATPDTGYEFVNWTGQVTTIADVNAATTTITMNADYTITANFQRIPRPPTNWPLIGGTIGAVVVVGLIIFFLRRRRRS